MMGVIRCKEMLPRAAQKSSQKGLRKEQRRLWLKDSKRALVGAGATRQGAQALGSCAPCIHILGCATVAQILMHPESI